MTRTAIQPQVLEWAVERAGLDTATLSAKFARFSSWVTGQHQPTLKQIEQLAGYLRVPVGFLFLNHPPQESLPIPDFRTIAGQAIARPSPDLLDVVHGCQERQTWFKEFAALEGATPLPFIGSVESTEAPTLVAATIRRALKFDLAERRELPSWKDALRRLIEQIDTLGVLVMVSGIVQNNTHRKLSVHEFRGFALSDPIAPLIFVNGADSKAAQMFTLAHELAHLWLGQSGLSDIVPNSTNSSRVEVWCNAVAAEILAPLEAVRHDLITREPIPATVARLARNFKVSTLVILRRLLDLGVLDRAGFTLAYAQELERIADARGGTGGDFYRTTISRTGKRFLRALVQSTLEGQTLYRDAFRMLGISKTETFNEIGRSLRFQV